MTEQEKINSIKEDIKKISNDSMTDAELIQNIKWIIPNLSQNDKTTVSTILVRSPLLPKDRRVLIEIYGKQLNNELKEFAK